MSKREAFYYDGKPDASGEYLIVNGCPREGEPFEMPGWYRQDLDGELIGPFETRDACVVHERENVEKRYPNGAPMFAPDGMMLDDEGNRSIFDDVDE